MKLSYCILFLTLAIVSCKKDSPTTEGEYAFFGGEIVNPPHDYVVIYKSNLALDTIQLDRRNRFLYKVENLEAGIFSFSDGYEYQTVILEDKDSIMFRLNTIEFDESLVFTGKGAKKNNYLINMFLKSEKDDKYLLQISQLPPDEFVSKLDSIKTIKENALNFFGKKYVTSKLFNKIAKANIDYSYYSSKEAYPFTNYSNTELEIFNNLPEDFYTYRTHLDYNDSLVKDYYPYRYFLVSHFNNMALSSHFKKSKDSVYNNISLDFNLEKLKLIDEKVSDEYIKNTLLSKALADFIKYSKNVDDYDIMFKSYALKNTNNSDISYAKRIVDSYKRLKHGNKLPDFEVIDYKNNTHHIIDVLDKPTVIYFWTSQNKNHFIDSHNKSKELKVKYPEIAFISINIDGYNPEAWTKLLKDYNFVGQTEYRLKDPKTKRQLSIYPINKVFLVDKNKKIVNAKANMFPLAFEKELLSVLNK